MPILINLKLVEYYSAMCQIKIPSAFKIRAIWAYLMQSKVNDSDLVEIDENINTIIKYQQWNQTFSRISTICISAYPSYCWCIFLCHLINP